MTRLSPRGPRPELRARILDAARCELEARRSLVERVWRSRAFWTAAAAAALVGIVLIKTPDGAPVQAPPAAPSPEAVETAESLAAALGDGEALAAGLARRLSGPAAEPRSVGMDALMKEIICQG